MGMFRDRDNEDNGSELLHLILFRLPSLLNIHIAVRIIPLPLPIPRHRTRLNSRPLPPVLYPALHLPTPTTAPHNAQVRYLSHRLSSHPRWLLPTPYNNFPRMCIHHMGCRFLFLCLLWLNILVDMGMQVGCMDNNSSLDSI